MKNARTVFLNAVKSFPRWMDIRKRPETSNGGKLIQSIAEEWQFFDEALEDYKKDFFLVSYVGREDTIPNKIWAYLAGDIELENIELENYELELTSDAKKYMAAPEKYCLLQQGYLMVSPQAINEEKNIRFRVNGYLYGGEMTEVPLWNIFDEFALFLGLKRFENESNRELMLRCFKTFQNGTNCTETGIKNAIINAVGNYVPLEEENIKIETPNENNILKEDSTGEEIYEKLAQFNQDMFRTKKWDMDTWEHNFKTSGLIPHTWDVPIEEIQDGTGSADDFQVMLTNDMKELESTDLEVTGYKADKIAINSYMSHQNILKEIPMQLEKYNNELKAKEVQYQITATPTIEIENPDKIIMESYEKIEGETQQYLEDIILRSSLSDDGSYVGDAQIINPGELEDGKKYKLRFKPKSLYSSMVIDKADIIYDDKATSLLKENSSFKKKNSSLVNINVAAHAEKVSAFKRSINMINSEKGLRIAPSSGHGELQLDVTGMSGKYLYMPHVCEEDDITKNKACISYTKEFVEHDDYWAAETKEIAGTFTINVRGYSLAFDYINPTKQGSCSVTVTVDGSIDNEKSGLWTNDKSFRMECDKPTSFHVEIKKMGMHEIRVANIKSKRYEVKTYLDNAENKSTLLKTAYGFMIPPLTNKDLKNTLHIEIENYGQSTPYIQFVHVGIPLNNAFYEITDIEGKAGASLDVMSNCIVELYVEENGKYKIKNKNYSTKNVYINNTDDDIYIGIDTGKFVSISSSSKKIESAYINGSTVKCIRLNAGEKLDSIKIVGTLNKCLSRNKLTDVIGLLEDEKIFVSSNAEGFIIKNPTTNEEHLTKISRDFFPSAADIITYENVPEEICPVFEIDKEKISSIYQMDRDFEDSYLAYKNKDKYVAYNKQKMFTEKLDNVEIVNTFYPILDTTKSMYYVVAPVVKDNDNTTVLFNKPKNDPDTWSLGLKSGGLKVETKFSFMDTESYNTEKYNISKIFTVSNNMELPATIELNGEKEELAKYIITVPNDMEIKYSEEACKQELIIENDGFNKLFYSNIVEIMDVTAEDGTQITDYKLLGAERHSIGQEGIIIWTNNKDFGKTVSITYKYRVPKVLKYKSINSLYELTGYTTNAYKKINDEPLIFEGLKDGSICYSGLEGADKVIIKCSNLNFKAFFEGGLIRVKKVINDNMVAVNAGYYYDEGDEYYMFNNLHEELIDRMSGIELIDVKHIGNTFVFIKKSKNYVKDTTFNPFRDEILCQIDCAESPRIKGISKLNSITACDSYNMWKSMHMRVSLKQGLHDMALWFEPEDESGYAILDITEAIENDSVLSVAVSDDISCSIMSEILAGGQHLRRSIFAEKLGSMRKKDKIYAEYTFGDIDKNKRYYLMVKGKGMIDDLIVANKDENKTGKALHQKVIEKLGFSIEEKTEVGTKLQLAFDSLGAITDGLDITKDGKLITGTTVDWGLTRIYESSKKMDLYRHANGVYRNGSIYAEDVECTVTTEQFYLNNYRAMNSLYVKVNDIMTENTEGMTIKVYGTEDLNKGFTLLSEDFQTNLSKIPGTKLTPYIQIVVDIPKGKVINNLEVYAEYAETASALSVVNKNNGSFVSKVYDTAETLSCRVSGIDGEVSELSYIRFSVRSCRRDTGHEVWSKWYEIELDENLNAKVPHVFEKYGMFQFKIELLSSKANCKIRNFNIEVI